LRLLVVAQPKLLTFVLQVVHRESARFLLGQARLTARRDLRGFDADSISVQSD
jgi:hypothetical protein